MHGDSIVFRDAGKNRSSRTPGLGKLEDRHRDEVMRGYDVANLAKNHTIES